MLAMKILKVDSHIANSNLRQWLAEPPVREIS
jgi:hypothetical protein